MPVINGRIVEDSFRLRAYANVLELMAEYAGLVVMSHQGRPGNPDFIPLKQHWIVLRKLISTDIDIEYIPANRMFTEETKRRIRELKEKEIILLDNTRMFEEEFNFNLDTSIFLKFFKGLIKTCVNDAAPCWHRDNTSLMCLPYIAETYIGVRSVFELKALNDIFSEKEEDCGIIMGGAKLTKVNYLINILSRMECFLGGLPGQLVARAKGYDLGKRNNEFLEKKFKQEEFQIAKMIVKKFKVYHPVDFVVFEKGERKNVHITELRNSNGMIMDVGEETVELYAKKLQEKVIRIRAGPLGVYEQGYNNGIKLTKMIAGYGLIFVGGDTSQEIVQYGLDQTILSTGGVILLSGGSFLHGLAGFRYPSVDLIIEQGKIPRT